MRVLGIGYATPYLGLFREEAERCLAFMPAAQGVVKWPSARPTLDGAGRRARLPLPDAAVDRVLLVHALEMSHDAGALLREVWRVLAAGGRLLAVVPNRRGVWARIDTTPFGHGRPYSRSQITQLLRETWFTPTGWSEALYVPPIARGWFLRSAVAWERTGATISAPFAGVHIVEATKQVYRAIPARREKRRLVPALEPVLAPSPGGPQARELSVSAGYQNVKPGTSCRDRPRKQIYDRISRCLPRRALAPCGRRARPAVAAPAAMHGKRSGWRRRRSADGCRWSRVCGSPPVMKDGSRSTSPCRAAAVRRLRAAGAGCCG